ncbi:uncharacterized protein TRAVEDRAFT_31665 [Trametes versicolor FP-101664 SS1]|uniref:uncharacterized protein n=1 Tax=Trametes versicolor (strain FP-101664) TaxID=717944 RepID=UPI0004621F16|nr:uncharacterized protein TRAVEDRAFT_31665 [Trametes versicolor FP-101664 SS1]EIW53582.1 hypothetical protein TRAVEDRAFT_31665 [Trametes versicolor FP-101664 SS1]
MLHRDISIISARPAIPPHLQLPEGGKGNAQVSQQLVISVVFAIFQFETVEKRKIAMA